jgi:DNA integrity scanning protein DisA with diadenylate cyclase activity
LRDLLLYLYHSNLCRKVFQLAALVFLIDRIVRFLGKAGVPRAIRRRALVFSLLALVGRTIAAWWGFGDVASVFDYLLAGAALGMIIVFQPELRRGLLLLARHRADPRDQHPVADKLADAAQALSRDCRGALIAVQRHVALAAYAASGEQLDAELSVPLLQTIFGPRGPLHDGAVIIARGRILAAACQLPLDVPPEGGRSEFGMRHRAARCLSEETDAFVLVVSEETGRISVAIGGKLEPVPRDNLSRRLAALISSAQPTGDASPKAA